MIKERLDIGYIIMKTASIALEIDDDLIDNLWRCSAIYAAALALGIGLRGDIF